MGADVGEDVADENQYGSADPEIGQDVWCYPGGSVFRQPFQGRAFKKTEENIIFSFMLFNFRHGLPFLQMNHTPKNWGQMG